MTLPMPPQAPPTQPAPMIQAPVPPPSPFKPRPNDTEPAVALQIVKRLSKLMFDPRYAAMPPEWRLLVDDKYLAARQVLTPPPPPEAQGPPQGGQPQKPQQPKAPKVQTTGAAPISAPSVL